MSGNLYEVYAPGRLVPLGWANQPAAFCGVGVCDSTLQASVNALSHLRYDTVLFRWTLTADCGDLCIETGQTHDAFVSGVGGPIDGGWWTKTCADTDLLRDGLPTDRCFYYVAIGMTFEALKPFQRANSGVSATDCRLFSAWLRDSESGAGYGFQIQKAMIDYTCVTLVREDTGCEQRLGVGAFFPQIGGPRGSQSLGNGLICSVAGYMPFAVAYCFPGDDDADEVTVRLHFGQCLCIQNVGSQPTISGSTPPTPPTSAGTASSINAINDGTVYAPVRIAFIGYPILVDAASVCGGLALTQGELAMLKQALGTLPQCTPAATIQAPQVVVGAGPAIYSPAAQQMVQQMPLNVPMMQAAQQAALVCAPTAPGFPMPGYAPKPPYLGNGQPLVAQPMVAAGQPVSPVFDQAGNLIGYR